MRRRTLLAAAGLAAPVQLLAGMDTALAAMPDPTGSAIPLDVRLAKARSAFDAAHNAHLLVVLPELLADAHDGARQTRTDVAYGRLSSAYSLASQLLTEVGRYEQSRLTVDRASVYAELSGSPLTVAAVARELSIVLRHQNQPAVAQRLVLSAVSQVEATARPSGRWSPRPIHLTPGPQTLGNWRKRRVCAPPDRPGGRTGQPGFSGDPGPASGPGENVSRRRRDHSPRPAREGPSILRA